MCGIAGFISASFNKDDLVNMTRTLTHRGPDAEGYFHTEHQDKNIGLGHRRLSIMDLSDAANQPFHSDCGRYTMVYNGEVYNFKEIRNTLEGNSAPFKTTGDTEVLLRAFVEWGPAFIEKLNGMFAIAIWDDLKKILLLFRDRMGIKPLYYFHSATQFLFASELKAITALIPAKTLTINPTALAHYLHLGYIGKSHSIYNEIQKFPSGSTGTLVKNQLVIDPFWKLENKVKPQTIKGEEQAKSQLDQLLQESVQKRLISDVPVGVFLSGGTDSSTIAAIAQHSSSSPIRTFSIGFKENKHNESEHAREVAKHLKTEHFEYILSHQDALDQFSILNKVYDEPFGDTSAVPTLMVSEMARKEVTVALSGDGGDELFLGYGMYKWAQRLNNPLFHHGRPLFNLLLKQGNSRYKRIAKMFDYSHNEDLRSHLFSQEQYCFDKRELSSLLITGNSISSEMPESLQRHLNPMEQQALFDLQHYLKDDLLVKVDRASMAHALEVRVPLLDHNIVEFAMNLDPGLKYKNGTMKHLLKEVLYQYVPKNILDRPKWGFSIPLGQWLKTELHYLIDTYLNQGLVETVGLVNTNSVLQLKTRFLNGEDYLYNRIWLLIQLHRWMKEIQHI